MTKYLLVLGLVTFIVSTSLNCVNARNVKKRDTGDDPTVDSAAVDTDAATAGVPSTDGAPGTDAVSLGTEPQQNSLPDTEAPMVSTGTELVPDGPPQSDAPVDIGSTAAQTEESGQTLPVSTTQSETPGSVPVESTPESGSTIQAESPGPVPAEMISDSTEPLSPIPEQTPGMTSEAGAPATVQGSEPVLVPGSEMTPVAPGSEVGPVASVVPDSETAVVDTGTPAIVSEVAPQVITELQPVPVGTVGSGSEVPTVAVCGTDGTCPSTGGPVPTENADVFPFQGGFVFDSPFFSFAQIEDYFKKLEKAMEKIFRDTIKDVNNDSDIYKNTTERVVDVDGTRYRVHTTIVRGGDENNAVSIEAVSAIPESQRRKRSLF